MSGHAIPAKVLLEATQAMSEARIALSRTTTVEHFRLACRLAEANGALIGHLGIALGDTTVEVVT